MNCIRCGRQFEGEGMRFCPFCGAEQREEKPEHPDAAKWVEKALAVKNLKEREKVLLQAREACPDCLSIEWELLFIGHPRKPPRGKMDFSIIKSYLLEIYRKPGDFSPERLDEMRRELFDDPQLRRCQALSGTPEATLEDYIRRLCQDYIEIFLEGDSRVSGTIFGFRLERNRSRALAAPVARMIEAIRQDQALTPEQQTLLTHGLYRGFEQRTGGTGRLDEALSGTL